MKTKTWIMILSAIFLLCLAMSAWLLWPNGNAAYAQVWSKGKLLYTLPLAVDRVLTVETELGTNVITVEDGRIAVTEADCPDGYCMDRGFCASGLQIVCLPNQLEIRFLGEQEVDGVVG